MKFLIAAIAMTIAVPAAAAGDPHNGHAPADHANHTPAEHAAHQAAKADCCKEKDADGSMKDCCEAAAKGQKMACCDKHDQHQGHDQKAK